MIKRAVFILIWTAVCFFVPPFILGFISALLKLPNMFMWVLVVPILTGPLGLIMGLRGIFPGTQKI